jgi:hypothetical protein
MRKIFILLLVFITGCSSTYERRPASLKNSGFLELLDEIETAVEVGTTSVVTCRDKLRGFYQKLYNIDSRSIELEKFSNDQLEDFVRTSFLVRLQLKERMKVLSIENKESLECLVGIKDVVRAMRYLEDYFIELYYTQNNLMNKDYVTLTGDGIHYLKNPAFNFDSISDIKSGDVILSRGNAYSSAAIARIGDNDTQFSHLTLVYKDDNDKLFTSEAHIEIGNVVAPFDVHINQKNSRTVLFRHRDDSLASEAGKYMYEKIKKYHDKNGKNIQYDFAMDYHDDSKLFCSEVVYDGYKKAGKKLYNKLVDIPKFKTTFHPGIYRFLKRIGIPVNKENIKTFDTFGPGEIQFDPNFDLIAEWRNPIKIRDSRFKDAILTKIFTWMEDDGYRFRPKLGHTISHSTAWLLRRSKWARALMEKFSGTDLAEKFPLNMTVKQMNVFVVLDKVGESMYKQLELAQAKSKRPLSFKELYLVLENYRKQDNKTYKDYLAAKSHNLDAALDDEMEMVEEIRPDFHLLFRK